MSRQSGFNGVDRTAGPFTALRFGRDDKFVVILRVLPTNIFVKVTVLVLLLMAFPLRAQTGEHAAPGAGSTYVELDSWIYPAIERLSAQGVVPYPFLGLRPWTRRAIQQMLASAARTPDVEAIEQELSRQAALPQNQDISLDSLYTRAQYLAGTPLNDSYHFGQTLSNDFGRPYGHGWQQIDGFAARAEHGRFALFVRGEYQHTPSVPGYSPALANIISIQDTNPVQSGSGRPAGNGFRLLDTYASVTLLGQQLSFGKQSYWWGPGSASAMMLSDNAEPFYGFRIDRALPLYIPLLSRLLGPMRYDNFFARLSGHLYPRQPWFYGQKINFSPTRNLELGFARDAVIAGDNSTPLTFATFWTSFTSISSGTLNDPGKNVAGARHGSFDFRYRLPGVRNWLTLYADSLVHDDVSPVDAPRRAATTAGLFVAQLPRLARLDLHVEGGSTDIPARSRGGKYYYYEGVYRDCYLNKGDLMGSWLGREATGGAAWTTWWFAPQSTLQLGYRTLRVSRSFVPQGEGQQSAYGELRYRAKQDVDLQFLLQVERWAAPALTPAPQIDVTTQLQITFHPRRFPR